MFAIYIFSYGVLLKGTVERFLNSCFESALSHLDQRRALLSQVLHLHEIEAESGNK
jgi:hypothetical protein